MRLDAEEREALSKALSGIEGEVYLFGSRVDDSKKGGDIDILIFSGQKPLKLSNKVATNFFLHCEEKIDVVVLDPEKLSFEEKAFLNSLERIRIQ